MALKKSELYSSLWSSCDELRGGMDASQYKDWRVYFVQHGQAVVVLLCGGAKRTQARDTRALLNRLPARHERWTY